MLLLASTVDYDAFRRKLLIFLWITDDSNQGYASLRQADGLQTAAHERFQGRHITQTGSWNDARAHTLDAQMLLSFQYEALGLYSAHEKNGKLLRQRFRLFAFHDKVGFDPVIKIWVSIPSNPRLNCRAICPDKSRFTLQMQALVTLYSTSGYWTLVAVHGCQWQEENMAHASQKAWVWFCLEQ